MMGRSTTVSLCVRRMVVARAEGLPSEHLRTVEEMPGEAVTFAMIAVGMAVVMTGIGLVMSGRPTIAGQKMSVANVKGGRRRIGGGRQTRQGERMMGRAGLERTRDGARTIGVGKERWMISVEGMTSGRGKKKETRKISAEGMMSAGGNERRTWRKENGVAKQKTDAREKTPNEHAK